MGDVRTLMLQRAAHIAAGVQSEEAWHIVSLFQKTNKSNFMQIIHSILASYLNLSYDYFDDSPWPPSSKLNPPVAKFEYEESSSDEENYGPEISSSKPRSRPLSSPSSAQKSKFARILPGQSILPSMYKTPVHYSSSSGVESSSAESLDSFHPAFRSPTTVLPGLRSTQIKAEKVLPFNKKHKSDSAICRYILDYMLNSPDLYKAEGLFRRPGNQSRINDLCNRLNSILCIPSYHKMCEPDPNNNYELDRCRNTHQHSKRNLVYLELSKFSPHDVACLLMKSLSKCCQSTISKGVEELNPLVAPQISQLLFMATQLQYDLVQSSDTGEDWAHILCHARQLLTYRIVIQLLMPQPERRLLIKLLELYRRVSEHAESSMMSAGSLATCVVLAIFGAPLDSSITTPEEAVYSNGMRVSPLKLRIDTLTNLIRVVHELNSLPGVLYKAIKSQLRSKLGHSPVQKCSRAYDFDKFSYIDFEASQKYRPYSFRPKSVCRSNSTAISKEIQVNDTFAIPPVLTRNRCRLGSTNRSVISTSANSTSSGGVSRQIKDMFSSWRRIKLPSRSNDKLAQLRKVKSSMVLHK